MAWDRKFEYIGARSFDEVLQLWNRRSPVGVELGQNRLAELIEHLTTDISLPLDGIDFVGPIESRTLISELYCGALKAINLNFHAQLLASNRAYTNGSLHSFSSLVQFLIATVAVFGVFIIRIRGKYYILDVFPWLGHPKEDRRLKKLYGENWWRYGRIISDKKDIIEQSEIIALFQRCLRVVSSLGWPEVLVQQLVACEAKWLNRPRNNVLYNFTGWIDPADLIEGANADIGALLKSAARTIFSPDDQMQYGSLPQSLLVGGLFVRAWDAFRSAVAMELAGAPAPALPMMIDPGLINAFEIAMRDEMERGASDR